ncbi:MAG TPA: enoyl-CoA hydratase/isomerase family protein [Leptospiraceae bacterium]|nr:enoyl-CoA hydratase/isomerase family protein [Leptospiraceae bacterium]HRG45325.1 enoyl-CoA hydratase/isomerase family protein [Leptospiraceae bacterium]HRG73641.1 enoyl-CoA hydratase/isomerase family protein [Leptospiraceae bacterium]
MNFKREALNLSGGKAELITIQTNEQNSLTRPTMLELAKILKEIQTDDSYKGAILTSENPKFFSNGLDAETLINTPPDELVDAVGGICILFGEMLRFDKPLVAEVTGHAMGGGAVMTMACDYKYMLSTGCRISFTEIGFGLPLPGMFVYKLQQSIHLTKLNEICMEAAAYKGPEAKEVGMIDEIAATKEDLRKLSIKKLESVFRFPLSAVRYTKQNINMRALDDFETHLRNSRDWLSIPAIKNNMLEAMKALKEKRRPVFV